MCVCVWGRLVGTLLVRRSGLNDVMPLLERSVAEASEDPLGCLRRGMVFSVLLRYVRVHMVLCRSGVRCRFSRRVSDGLTCSTVLCGWIACA